MSVEVRTVPKTKAAKGKPYELADGVPFLLNRVGMRSLNQFEKKLSQEAITVSMFRVLVMLGGGEAKRLGDLAGPASLEPPTVSRSVKALQRIGCVQRQRSTDDERIVGVTITRLGRAMLDRLLPAALALEKQMIVDLTPAEVATLKRLLVRLNANLVLADDESESSAS